MTEYGTMTLNEFRDALASNSPTPGGGSASAVALSQAAALAIMVCELTDGRQKWKDGWAASSNTRLVASPILKLGHTLATRDAIAFDGVMDAYRMPKSTDNEISERVNAINDATILAYTVPMETSLMAITLLDSLIELAQHGNANAVTDVGVASLLASAACKGGLFNAEINLKSLDSNIFKEQNLEIHEMRKKCSVISRQIMTIVHDRIHS
jgi:formiminotetrahydrofolate cyclodeaminase